MKIQHKSVKSGAESSCSARTASVCWSIHSTFPWNSTGGTEHQFSKVISSSGVCFHNGHHHTETCHWCETGLTSEYCNSNRKFHNFIRIKLLKFYLSTRGFFQLPAGQTWTPSWCHIHILATMGHLFTCKFNRCTPQPQHDHRLSWENMLFKWLKWQMSPHRHWITCLCHF